jgi:hypothetical protein
MKSEDWFAIFFWGCIFFLGIRYEYIKYLERKKKEKAQIKLKDLKNMSKEELDSMSYADRSRVLDEALEKFREAPQTFPRGNEYKKARKEFIEVQNTLGGNLKPGDIS